MFDMLMTTRRELNSGQIKFGEIKDRKEPVFQGHFEIIKYRLSFIEGRSKAVTRSLQGRQCHSR